MIPISIGELFNKVSILEIKMERITDPSKISNYKLEMELLNKSFPAYYNKIESLIDKPKKVC